MSAQIIVLAQWKADHAVLQIRFEPLLAWCAWYSYLTGDKPKVQEPKAGEVREFVGQKCLNN